MQALSGKSTAEHGEPCGEGSRIEAAERFMAALLLDIYGYGRKQEDGSMEMDEDGCKKEFNKFIVFSIFQIMDL